MSHRNTHGDVLIIGGGLMGTSAAFFLRHRHGRSVTLLERELVGRQASGTNFGNVRRQGRDLAQLPLANRARAIWGRLPELIGEDLERPLRPLARVLHGGAGRSAGAARARREAAGPGSRAVHRRPDAQALGHIQL